MAPPGQASHQLPRRLTSFVGRSTDLDALGNLLQSGRLVTLVGAGGVGKSRLALEVARGGEKQWSDGTWWIELGVDSDVADAVRTTLELPGRGPAAAVVSAWLAPRNALVVLDSCEAVVGECAQLAEALLERCPHLGILATSREALGVPGEVRRHVGPLDEADAVRLFEARGRLVDSAFHVGGHNLESVTEICNRLDRLPLAIEMAAAHLDVLSEKEVLANLDDRMRLLRSGARNAPERQQTMAAAIEWSYRLLSEEEARLFRRLAVFKGGFTLEAAQAIALDPGETDVLAVLSALVRKSMTVAERLADGATRYRLLESHHAFAFDRLSDSSELELMRRRHLDYFQRWLDSARHPSRKSTESDNLWSALDWARGSEPERGVGLALRLAEFEFSDHARLREAVVDVIEHRVSDVALQAKAVNLAGRLVARQGDAKLSKSLADSSVKLARKQRDPEVLAYVLRGAGVVYQTRGDQKAAQAMYSEALATVQDSKDEELAAEIKNSLGVLLVESGDQSTALNLLAECVAYSRRRSDHPRQARYLESLANAQLAAGDLDAAAASWSEAIRIFRDLNDAFGTLWSLGGLALVASQAGDHRRAVRLASAVDRMSREWSLTTGPHRYQQVAAAVALARDKLGEPHFRGAWDDGRAMRMEQAIEYGLGSAEPAPPRADDSPLTRRERDVVALIAAGLTNRQIAERLFISERTAEGHVERIRGKLGVRSRTEVATWAVTRGLADQKLDNSTRSSSVSAGKPSRNDGRNAR